MSSVTTFASCAIILLRRRSLRVPAARPVVAGSQSSGDASTLVGRVSSSASKGCTPSTLRLSSVTQAPPSLRTRSTVPRALMTISFEMTTLTRWPSASALSRVDVLVVVVVMVGPRRLVSAETALVASVVKLVRGICDHDAARVARSLVGVTALGVRAYPRHRGLHGRIDLDVGKIGDV